MILLFGVSSAVAVTLLVPSLSAATLNTLFRLRGEKPPPDDIIILAIDDASLQQIGSWTWSRSVMASILDRITAAQPRAIGLDVIYAEPSDPSADKLLTEAIRRNGRVVLPAQLAAVGAEEPSDSPSASNWLLPLPEIKSTAAGIGHAHADPDVDGVLRMIQLSKADESGARLWAFGLETLRVAERTAPNEIEETNDAVRLGRYKIDIHDEAKQATLPGVTVIRPNEMFINYLGPAAYIFLLQRRISPQRKRRAFNFRKQDRADRSGRANDGRHARDAFYLSRRRRASERKRDAGRRGARQHH